MLPRFLASGTGACPYGAARSRRARFPLKTSGTIPAPVPPPFAPSMAWHPAGRALRAFWFPRAAIAARHRGAFRPACHPWRKALRAVHGLASLPFVFASLTVFPASRQGAFCACAVRLRRATRVRSLRFPASRPLHPASLPALCARPLWRCRSGGGVGAVPASLWRAPGALSAAPGGGGVGGSRWSLGLCGGVPWLCSRCLVLPVSCRSFPWRCVRPAVGSRPGAVPPWVCRSAVPPARCRGLSPSRGSARSPPRPALRCLGVGVCRCVRVFARCARCPVASRCRCRFARACRRAGRGCVPWCLLGALRVSLPVLVACVGGCRWRWLVRGGARCLVVRCRSRALAVLVCRRARAFGLPPLRAGRSGRLVLLPAARPRGPSALSVRLGTGPAALSAPQSLPGVPLPVPPRGGSSCSLSRFVPPVSLRQGRLF